MYCVNCGGEFGPKEQYCFNCGEPRPKRTAEFKGNRFMSGNGLRDNFIPMLWEFIIIGVLADIIASLLFADPSSLSEVAVFSQSMLDTIMDLFLSGDFFGIIRLLNSAPNILFSQASAELKVSLLLDTLAQLLELVLFILAAWRIFKKASLQGWKSLIPIYNIYCVFKIVLGNGWYFLLPILYAVFAIVSSLALANWNTEGLWLLILYGIIALIFYIWFLHKACVLYHHGWGYTLGLLFIPELFVLFLGWGGNIVDGE